MAKTQELREIMRSVHARGLRLGATSALVPTDPREAKMMAAELAQARQVGGGLVQSAPDVFLRIMAGLDLGIPVTVALREIHFIDGRTEMSARLMQALVRASRKCKKLRLEHKSPEEATWAGWRTDDPSFTYRSTVTMQQCEKAGFIYGRENKLKTNWQNHPAAMLSARALSALCRDAFGDVLLGCYVEGELSDAIEAAEADDVVDAEELEWYPRLGSQDGIVHWREWRSTGEPQVFHGDWEVPEDDAAGTVAASWDDWFVVAGHAPSELVEHAIAWAFAECPELLRKARLTRRTDQPRD